MIHQTVKLRDAGGENAFLTPAYGSRAMSEPVPKYELPEKGLPPQIVYDLIHDELILDGNSRLNLATFVTTWMEDEAKRLMAETFDKNMIDKDEYPQTAEIELRCVNMLSRLWNARGENGAVGCSTIGSSEAAMLGGMALKWKWRQRMKDKGKPADKPNMVMGINVQVCWEKFCRYWEIEPRRAPMEGNRFCLTAEEAVKLIDENTIGVVAIMGSTFDGRYENVKEINDAIVKLNAEKGWDVPIHVDGASGGFVAPFLQPRLEWDFRLPTVKSINASGHKFGLVFPGVGWIVWRDKAELPGELIFHCNYLGGDLPNFALNFSRPGNQIVAQYYNFLRLGREGYRRIHQTSRNVAMFLSGRIAEMGPFDLISDGGDIPVFAFTTNERASFSAFDISEKLRERGWLVPAYTFPKNREDLAVLRCVCKEGFTRDMADMLLRDLRAATDHFASKKHHKPRTAGTSFHH
ncbi:MAG: glutamate decarboxylase [Planctomycetes bacterium]|nr:glutamate decarboxylase [Planctomycetota bacterium]MBU4399502.1 glutamate decarboxylase [Planctomycetota bacterium]MCG2685687.1 glutamate decarboxylase [Planctomycetales bacterium]